MITGVPIRPSLVSALVLGISCPEPIIALSWRLHQHVHLVPWRVGVNKVRRHFMAVVLPFFSMLEMRVLLIIA